MTIMNKMKKIEWLIIPGLVALSMILFQLSPDLLRDLQLDRDALLRGEYWRIITGNFVHWSWDHLVWDVGTFLILGSICYHQNKKQFWYILMISPMVVSFLVLLAYPQLELYRGVSGIDVALFASVALQLMSQFFKKNRYMFSVGVIGFFCMAAKVSYEFLTGSTLFVSGDGYISLPGAHLAGMITGFIVWFYLSIYRWRVRVRIITVGNMDASKGETV